MIRAQHVVESRKPLMDVEELVVHARKTRANKMLRPFVIVTVCCFEFQKLQVDEATSRCKCPTSFVPFAILIPTENNGAIGRNIGEDGRTSRMK